LIAEELSVPFDRVTLLQCDTARTPDQGQIRGAVASCKFESGQPRTRRSDGTCRPHPAGLHTVEHSGRTTRGSRWRRHRKNGCIEARHLR
jgi:hypothetical protein